MGLTKVFWCRYANGVYTKSWLGLIYEGTSNMGFFSRLMGGAREQADKTSEFEILAPVSGELVPLEKTADPVFSGRAMGDGVAVDPDGETILAPVSGTVAALW